jgi:hypothetical protein
VLYYVFMWAMAAKIEFDLLSRVFLMLKPSLFSRLGFLPVIRESYFYYLGV